MKEIKFIPLDEQYKKLMADHICVSVEDLSDTEQKLIEHSYYLFKNKLNDMKDLEDEIKRLSIELANLKSMQDDTDYNYNELGDE